MWKQVSALARGRVFEASEAACDRNALTILRQQIRDCAQALAAARRDVALAALANRREEARIAALDARIGDLETRTMAALDQGKADLAHEGALSISKLEAERARVGDSLARLESQAERLQRRVTEAEQRLCDLKGGLRLAEAGESLRRGGGALPGPILSVFDDAEQTLTRLRSRQEEDEAIDAFWRENSAVGDPDATARRLAEAGCGAPLDTGAEAVLRRIDAKRAARSA
ncbi:hypothetical protein NS365_10035 [Aureimonas ureilytica]|uniref:PspA family regulator n=1 Tax=Aureimonas ureilytica TaxID=401562 RepID=A0A175RRU0_9HYPH|nr:PspA/IM30 family protein [Aureimonas ureilytica]KTR05724.1 hypothetical protein NS365_10035 [Aureimonas ureilytica]